MSLVLEKGLKLIDLVEQGADTLAGIAKAAGMSRSTTHRLLATLVAHDYLSLQDRRYRLGYRFLELGEAKRRSFDFLDPMHPVLVRYALQTRDTVHIALLDELGIVLIDRVYGDRELRINSYPGLRNRACSTAVGKVLLAHQPQRQWAAHLAQLPADYPRSHDELAAELRQAQMTNIAIDRDECSIGTCGIASSFLITRTLRAACSINGATIYFSTSRLSELEPVVHRLAAELEECVAQGGKSPATPAKGTI